MSDQIESSEGRPRIGVLKRGGLVFTSARGRKVVPLSHHEMRVLARVLTAQARVLENKAHGAIDLDLHDE